jgi:TolA-binding protein
VTLAILFGNIWFRRACIVVLVLVALFAVRQHYINLGKTQGTQNQAQQSANQGAADVKSDHVSTVNQITQLNQQINLLQKQVDTTQTLILAIVQQRQQATQAVAVMTKDQVDARIDWALGRSPGASEYTLDDKRRIAECFTQLPLCNKENVQYQTEIGALEEKQVTSEKKYDTLTTYTVNLERNYTELWNEKALPKRSPKCLYLWKCSRPKISQPNPADLKPKG